MRRRDFIAGLGSAVAWPLAARAQQGERIRRVGVLTYSAEGDPDGAPIQRLLRDELEKLGWTEGRNLRLDWRFANNDATLARVLAADLAQLAPDVIVTGYFVPLRAVQQETKKIPVVFIGGGDAVEIGTVINPHAQRAMSPGSRTLSHHSAASGWNCSKRSPQTSRAFFV
jgi:putative tryptophan/tyrosine transport system substrate-binding protein